LAVLGSCTSATSVPANRRDSRAVVHVVQSGETLYKIAWQYRIDMQELVNWNGIQNPDELRVGQRLRLVPPRGYVAAAPERPADTPRQTTSAPARTSPPPRSTASTAAVPQPRAPASSAAGASAAPRPAVSSPTPPRWSWPTDGSVVARFGGNDAIGSGIGIGGRAGQPVRAAAAGRVVYAGGGLIGYGQLVIIKHDETFLSAYGYNAELLVTQGQEVARGATIALMGQGPGRQPRLHFEIRRNGVPVDPLLFVTAPR
jgi:lipoprotein NlpD